MFVAQLEGEVRDQSRQDDLCEDVISTSMDPRWTRMSRDSLISISANLKPLWERSVVFQSGRKWAYMHARFPPMNVNLQRGKASVIRYKASHADDCARLTGLSILQGCGRR